MSRHKKESADELLAMLVNQVMDEDDTEEEDEETDSNDNVKRLKGMF